MKKKKILVTGILVCAVFIGWLIKYHTDAHSSQPDPVWVEASIIKESTLPLEVNSIGALVARSSVEITSEVAGHVEKIFFQDGAFVKKGEPLIQLDDALYRAQFESAKARLAYSENDYRRKILLGKQGAIAKQAIDQAEADLKEKKADAQEKEVMLNKMKLMAPFDGVLGKCHINLGDYVTTGQSTVTLTDTRHLRIEYTVSERYLPLLKLGEEVKIMATAYPNKIFIGKLSFISPTINTDNRSIALYAEVPNENNLLAPGMFVSIVQSLGTDDHVLLIPARSLVPILEGEQVFKIVNGKAFAVTVTIGKRTEKYVQVMQGLSIGDQIITDGQLKVKNGLLVKVRSRG